MEWLQGHSELLVLVVGLNVLLSSVANFLDWLQDKTTSEVDNKLNAAIKKILGWMKFLVDMVSANPKH